jgi:hypothetical protein
MRLSALILCMTLSAAAWAADSTVSGYLLDVSCSSRLSQKPDGPSAHSKDCLRVCGGSGFGVLTADKKFIKFDEQGNEKVRNLLNDLTKDKDIRISVTGAVDGDKMTVSKVELSK